jgi:serine/threonine protein kinase
VTSERWRRITALFHGARGRNPEQRESFLAKACGEDIALRRDVEAMLAGDEQPDRFDELLDSRAASAESTDALRLETGSQLGPYQILGFLGAGGMGHVYRAFDPRLHRDVAIKLSRERFSERFEREVRVIATLNHPNICTVHDVGPNFLVTELVEGETLREWLRHHPPVERILDIVRQVLEALRAAHRASIVHRDLKPENVMVRFDGYVKVLDFGLATQLSSAATLQADTISMETGFTRLPPVDHRISVPGQILGTIAYMSPEQLNGRDVDQRSDLFAVGIMFYEMLTRNHPWVRPSAGETLHAILHDDPPAIPVASLMEAELAAIVGKLLRKDPARRYGSAESVLEVLGSPASVRKPSEEAGRAAGGLTSIAVLPFQFLNDIESRDAWSMGFADG